jgi:hypothetical protein
MAKITGILSSNSILIINSPVGSGQFVGNLANKAHVLGKGGLGWRTGTNGERVTLQFVSRNRNFRNFCNSPS